MFPISTVWTLALNNTLTAAPAFDGATAFFSIADDRIAAYDLIPGRLKWIVHARPQMEPAAGDGLLFIVESDTLTALRQEDGSVAWRLPFAEKLAVHPVWDNGWLVAATMDGTIHAFRAIDGQPIWSRDVGSPAHAEPALAADRVYIPTADNRIVALQVETGAPIWDRRLGGAPAEILALDDRVFVGAKDNYFYCLMTKDGVVDWRWRTGGDVVGMPAVDEHRVYFVALDNVMRALDRKSGVQQWMRPLPLRPASGPAKAGGTLVVAGLSPTIRAYNLSDGVAAGEAPAGGDVAAPPHVIANPATGLPLLLIVARDLAKGASATLVTRSWDPLVTPIAPLPNIIPMAPRPDRSP